MESTVQWAIEAMEKTISQSLVSLAAEHKKVAPLPTRAPSPVPINTSKNTEIALQTAALEQMEYALEQRAGKRSAQERGGHRDSPLCIFPRGQSLPRSCSCDQARGEQLAQRSVVSILRQV